MCTGAYTATPSGHGACAATNPLLKVTWTGFSVTLTSTYGGGNYTATDGLHWLNGEHLDLAFETPSSLDSPHHEDIVATATGYFTLNGCSYYVTWTPGTAHQGDVSATFVKL